MNFDHYFSTAFIENYKKQQQNEQKQQHSINVRHAAAKLADLPTLFL